MIPKTLSRFVQYEWRLSLPPYLLGYECCWWEYGFVRLIDMASDIAVVDGSIGVKVDAENPILGFIAGTLYRWGRLGFVDPPSVDSVIVTDDGCGANVDWPC